METNESTKASMELIINDQVALSIDSDVEIGKQQLQSFHPEAHYYSDPQFRLFKTDAGWNVEHDEKVTGTDHGLKHLPIKALRGLQPRDSRL